MSHSKVETPYYSVARYRNSQHLDNDEKIGKLISENCHDFENFVVALTEKAAANSVPDGPELAFAVQLIEQAKDAFGRALIHSVGTCKGVPFESAVSESHVLVLEGCPFKAGSKEMSHDPFERAVLASVPAARKESAE